MGLMGRLGATGTRKGVAAGLLAAIALVAAGCGSSNKSSAAGTSATTASRGGRRRRGASAQARLGAAYDTSTTDSVTLNGAGANSINPFFERVFYDYHQKNSKTKVNYSPAGSSVGVKDIQQNTVDFGDTEIPMSAGGSGQGHRRGRSPGAGGPGRGRHQLQPSRALRRPSTWTAPRWRASSTGPSPSGTPPRSRRCRGCRTCPTCPSWPSTGPTRRGRAGISTTT